MSNNFDVFATFAAFWGSSLGIAATVYAGTVWFGRQHLSQEAKETLTSWLKGEHASTWSRHFCIMFDAVFGRRHLSLQCFFRSSLASVLAVFVLYIILDKILGVMEWRAPGRFSIWQVVMLGAAINIVPDYASLLETRLLLKKFEDVRSVIGQLGLLIADAVFSGAIIWFSINAFRLTRGETALSAIEMLALFSVYSLFFYSTFFTSIWAWTFCLSTWFMRLFYRTTLGKILDVESKPVEQVALMSSILIFLTALLITPAITIGPQKQVSTFDAMLCSVFPGDICPHVARLTTDDKEALSYLERACEGGAFNECLNAAAGFFEGDAAKSAALFQRGCEGDEPLSCRMIAQLYGKGYGVKQDRAAAARLMLKSCDLGDPVSCRLLGNWYSKGFIVKRDAAKAKAYYQLSCDLGLEDMCAHSEKNK